MQQPPPPNGYPHGYGPHPPTPPEAGHGYWPPPSHYGYPLPQSKGVHPLVWVALAFSFLAVFGLGTAFAVVAATRAMDDSDAVTPSVHSPPAHAFATENQDDDDDDRSSAGAAPNLPTPVRDIPVHEVKMLTGCSETDLATIENGIDDAIDVGAPAYNHGDFIGCYLTYDRAAKTIESKLAKSCKGPAKALEDGRMKAKTKGKSSADQAWAMRDTFDGLLDVIERRGSEL